MKKILPIYLSDVLKEKLEKVSSKMNISQNAIIKLALSEWLEKNSDE